MIKSLWLVAFFACICCGTSAIQAKTFTPVKLSFETSIGFQTEQEKPLAQFGVVFRPWRQSGFETSLSWQTVGEYDYTPTIENSEDNLNLWRLNAGYRWQFDQWSVTPSLGWAMVGGDVGQSSIEAGDRQISLGLASGYVMSPNWQLISGLNYDFGTGDLDSSANVFLGIRFHFSKIRRPQGDKKSRKAKFPAKRLTQATPQRYDYSSASELHQLTQHKLTQQKLSQDAAMQHQMSQQSALTYPMMEDARFSDDSFISGSLMRESIASKPSEQLAMVNHSQEVRQQTSQQASQQAFQQKDKQTKTSAKQEDYRFSLQLATFRNKDSIPDFVDKWQLPRAEVYTLSRGKYTVLRFGQYQTKEMAEIILEQFQAQGLEAIIVNM